jgi:hypothetical protein
MAFITAEPAAAAVVQTCGHVQGSATFTPGLTNTPTDNVVRAKAAETSCTPSTYTGGSGTLTATIKLPKGSCAGLAAGGQTVYGTATSTWKNGTVTKLNIRATTGTGANATLANVYGTITSGRFYRASPLRHLTVQVKFRVTSGHCTAANPIKSVAINNTKPLVIQ